MTALVIANTQIRRDPAGRYCLNDLHQASGGAEKNQPNRWLRLQQTQELVAEVLQPTPDLAAAPPDMAAVVTISEGFGVGTYAVKELVYAYAMWISPAFHLHVIRAYDALVQQGAASPPPLLPQPQHRADQLVSASRIFSAALRTARNLRMEPATALQAAFDCARRHTGIDWEQEIAYQPPPELAPPEDPLRERVIAWLAGRSSFQLQPLIAEMGVGRSDDMALMKRVAGIARSLGWKEHRRRGADGWFTEWRPVVH